MGNLPDDIAFSRDSAAAIADQLGWCAGPTLDDVVRVLINAMKRIDYLERRLAKFKTWDEIRAESEAAQAAADLASAKLPRDPSDESED